MEPARPGGFRSGSVLGSGVRQRTCAPEVLEILLDDVLERGVARRGLAHLRLDPRDVGCGRLAGDPIDYASAVERWLRRCVARADLAVLTTSDLATWWLEREAALRRTAVRVDAGDLLAEVTDPPPGTTLAVLEPAITGAGRRRRRVMLDPDPGDGARAAPRAPGSGLDLDRP
jgi:hypothetical protein